MRDLVEEIEEYYLFESLSKEPSSPIQSDKYGENRKTKLTSYQSSTQPESPNQYHKDYSGITHSVSWQNNRSKDHMDHTERKQSLHDAMHLHHHFIKHNTEVGDVVSNQPIKDEDGKGGNKRSRIYKAAGFGGLTDDEQQHGIVKQHPHDHEDESKRGQKYLHPLEQHEIDAHGDKPSRGASDNKIRHISRDHGNNVSSHLTKYNNVMHGVYRDEDGKTEHHSDVAAEHPNNEQDLKHSLAHHNNYLKSPIHSKTPTIDRILSNKKK